MLHALDADPPSWWAARLLTETLLSVPDATPYTDVLRRLTDRLVARRRREEPVPPAFGPAFWTALPLPPGTRFDLLRRLVLADGPPHEPGPRFLDAVAELLAMDPTAVQPHLARWFDDERPLPATPHATVAKAAQALLHTHRTRALDDLTEVLVGCAHRRADELLAVLAEDEPSAVCRAVDRWAHDERPARRVAAVAYGLRAAPHVRTEADRELLRYAALALLARPEDCTLHGGALALLVRDPRTRARHLPQALRHFAAGDPQFPPGALVPALATDPDPVLEAFRERLRRPGAGEALRTLADVTTPALARRVAVLVREAVQRCPEAAGDVAAYVDRRLDQGPAARAVLLPLVTGLLDGASERVRAALAAVFVGPGTPPPARCARNSSHISWTTNGNPRSSSPCCPRPPRAAGTASATSSGARASSSSAPRWARPASTALSSTSAGMCPGSPRWWPAGSPTHRRSGRGGRPQHPADDREPGGCTGSGLTPRASGHSPHADASDGHAAWHP